MLFNVYSSEEYLNLLVHWLHLYFLHVKCLTKEYLFIIIYRDIFALYCLQQTINTTLKKVIMNISAICRLESCISKHERFKIKIEVLIRWYEITRIFCDRGIIVNMYRLWKRMFTVCVCVCVCVCVYIYIYLSNTDYYISLDISLYNIMY